jgi:hypothetical protein
MTAAEIIFFLMLLLPETLSLVPRARHRCARQ